MSFNTQLQSLQNSVKLLKIRYKGETLKPKHLVPTQYA